MLPTVKWASRSESLTTEVAMVGASYYTSHHTLYKVSGESLQPAHHSCALHRKAKTKQPRQGSTPEMLHIWLDSRVSDVQQEGWFNISPGPIPLVKVRTLCPTLNPVTPSPISTISPTASKPSIVLMAPNFSGCLLEAANENCSWQSF